MPTKTFLMLKSENNKSFNKLKEFKNKLNLWWCIVRKFWVNIYIYAHVHNIWIILSQQILSSKLLQDVILVVDSNYKPRTISHLELTIKVSWKCCECNTFLHIKCYFNWANGNAFREEVTNWRLINLFSFLDMAKLNFESEMTYQFYLHQIRLNHNIRWSYSYDKISVKFSLWFF